MRPKRSFTAEFKKEAVKLVNQPEMTIAKVAKDLDLTPSALSNWVKQDKLESKKSNNPDYLRDEAGKELQQLRKENRILRMER